MPVISTETERSSIFCAFLYLPSPEKKRERIKNIKRNNNKNYSAQLKFQLSWKTTKILNWNQFFLMPVSVSSKKAGIRFRDVCRINCLDLPRWNETIIVVTKFYRRSVVMFGCLAVTNFEATEVTWQAVETTPKRWESLAKNSLERELKFPDCRVHSSETFPFSGVLLFKWLINYAPGGGAFSSPDILCEFSENLYFLGHRTDELKMCRLPETTIWGVFLGLRAVMASWSR